LKETFFYQVRQDTPLPLAELTHLVRQAFISLYPGTSFDEELTALYGSENLFFLSRTGRTENIAVFVIPEGLDLERLADLLSKSQEAEIRVRGTRSQIKEFLVSVVASKISEKVSHELTERQTDWSFFEYLLLQSEMDEGLALKPIHSQRICEETVCVEPPAVRVAAPQAATPSLGAARLPDRRLSPDELSALIDLSLGLELRSRGMTGDLSLPQKLAETEDARFRHERTTVRPRDQDQSQPGTGGTSSASDKDSLKFL